MSKKERNRRSSAKYPALEKKYNLRSRRFYIEPDYIDGVYNAEGECVIRPLTDEEKAWLNKFYSETIVTSFQEDGNFYTGEKRRELYKDNNRRNRCIFNLKYTGGQLDSFNQEHYEKLQQESSTVVDYEEMLIDQIERRNEEEETLKLRKPTKKTPKSS